MRRKAAIIGGIAALVVVQLLILSGYAVVLLRTELATIPSAETSSRLSPFLEFGRTVDRWVSAFYKGPTPEETLPQYALDISPDQWGRLLQSLPTPETAFNEDLAPWVPAVFSAEGKQWEVHVRVHGETPAHWLWPKKSYEVRFADDAPFHGMRQLQLLLPEEREWVNDLLRMRRSRMMGLVHPEVSFIDLHLNGRGPMIYLSSEGWSEDSAKRQGRGGDVALYRISLQGAGSESLPDAAYWERSGSSEVRASDDALGLLIELSRPGAETDPDYLTKLSQVMDLDRLSSYMALRLLMGNPVARADEMRLLYRSVNGRFEPVPWNIALSEPRSILAPAGIPLLDAASRVPALRSRAQAQLQEYLQIEASTDLQSFQTTRRNIEAPFYSDQWKLPSNRIVRNALNTQQDLLKKSLDAIRAQLASAEVLINERIPAEESEVLLVIDANARGPVAGLLSSITFPPRYAEILSSGQIHVFRDTGDGVYGEGDLPIPMIASGSTLQFLEGQERLLWPGNPAVTSEGELLRPPHRRHRFFLVGTPAMPRITMDALPLPVGIGNAVTGGDGQVLGTALVDDRVYGTILPLQMKRPEFLSRNPQFTAQGSSGVLLKGSVTLEGTIAIPTGISLHVAPGTQMRMGSGAILLSYGSVTMLGEEALPIRILPAKEGVTWGTIAVIDASEPSDLHFVTVVGGRGGRAGGKKLPGSITLAGSPGSITNVTVDHAEGDSAIALSQIFVDMRDTVIRGSAGRGVLVESALAGRMESVAVSTSSGHAIDLRGSPIVIRNVVVEGSSSACIHVADRSAPLIEDSRLQGCAVGILSEDGGHVVAKNVTLVGNQIGFSAGGGSPAFGPGSIVANGTVFVDNGEEMQEESGGVVAVE
ncbi:hypothetical protein A3C37_04585 [Candidatus Peribacteria bacterium RIFCSPHIGHO2_02_FULL_53_20]|nr:MAG: hypothetical protein A3C37_04585 [Candidatus Peribacteria bacterium RIFCSPHIGHO2_02_FULL_53_20]OGJ66193.1 MAG: hypothetical protein A3B61_02660 [Candidatus Peribacteria bacterium RIFCSPLOWO2_01_FULL_53_10]OGJ69905.1 MAG: hypothetical protein A3G69_02445 [Candidatus Peribacteria bacterium RIFCSPLOWO2_12_FULL_53_10]